MNRFTKKFSLIGISAIALFFAGFAYVQASPTVSITASPGAVDYNGTATIDWTVLGASSCTASSDPAGVWSGSIETSGEINSPALTADTTFTVSCLPSAYAFGTTIDTACAGTFTSNDYCASAPDIGDRSIIGSSDDPSCSSGTSLSYVTCDKVDSSEDSPASASASVTILPRPSVILRILTNTGSLLTSTNLPYSGGSITLAWTTTDVDSCTASSKYGDWIGHKSIGSGQDVVNVDNASLSPRDYTLTCTNSSPNINDDLCLSHKFFDVSWTGYTIDVGFDAGHACSMNSRTFDPYGTSGFIHVICDETGGNCNDNGFGVNDYQVGSCNDSSAGLIGAYLGGGATDLMIHIDSNSGLYNCQ